MALALALLAASGVLAVLLQHDGVGLDSAAVEKAQVGDHVRLRGLAVPAVAAPNTMSRPDARLSNYTYTFDAGDVVVLATSAQQQPVGTAIVEGTVLARGVTNDAAARPLVIVRVESWTTPLVFG